MHWTESRYWRTMALLAVVGLFTLAWSLGAERDLPVVEPAAAEDILIIPRATSPRLQILTTADNGDTLIWWHFKRDTPESLDLVETKPFRSR